MFTPTSLRTIATTVLITFTSLTLQPLQAAVITGGGSSTPPSLTADERYGKGLEDLRETTRRAHDKETKAQNDDAEVAQLRTRKTELETIETEVDAEFTAVGQHLIDNNLPPEILARHDAARTEFKTKQAELKLKLQAVVDADTAGDTALRTQRVQELDTFMQNNQHHSAPVQTDPNKLPFSVPDGKVRAPIESEAQFHASLFKTSPLNRMLAGPIPNGFTLPVTTLPATPTAADVAPTEDIVLTPAIQAQAAALNHNPVQIYNWVHNNIEFLPTYGSIQGADMTLQTKRGNSFDTASLLIGLLRASGIPARYVYGTIQVPADQAMNWVGGVTKPEAAQQLLGQGGIPNIGMLSGGVIKYIKLEHVWVEAYIDYVPSRGAVNRSPDTWVPMDASYKQYTYTQGMDIKTAVPLDAAALVTQAQTGATFDPSGWVQNVNGTAIQTALATYQTQVQDYINTTKPNATVGDVLGSKTIIANNSSILAGTLPYTRIATGGKFTALPDQVRHRFQYNLYANAIDSATDSPTISLNQSLPNLAGKKITLSFAPATQADADLIASYLPAPHADGTPILPSELPTSLPGYLIHLTAEMRVDGQVVSSGGTFTMGQELVSSAAVFDPVDGWTFGEDNKPIAGEYIATHVDLQGVGAAQVQAFLDKLISTKASFAANGLNNISMEELTGDSLYSAILSYFATARVERQMNSRIADMVEYSKPSYGSALVSARVAYWFGIPRNVSFPGIVMDVDRYATSVVGKDNDAERAKSYVGSAGMQLSAYEHLIPEKIFSNPNVPLQGVSAMKALALAFSQGQKIYTLNDSNFNLLSLITIDDNARAEIQNALYAGKEVTVHQTPILLNGWSGSGYIIADPVTGSGAYKISGGANGGALDFVINVAQQPALLLPPCGVSFLDTMINNFLVTNSTIPGIAFPTGAGLVTAKVVGDAVGGQTFLTAIKLSVKNPTFLLGNLRAALIVSVINFVLMSLIFEIGIFVGSAVGAAFCRKG